ncbi:MAG: cadherin repeat domain-containing protein, partial [Planctomycetaceae bacterium]|nr:cadherin repeat domain-containing protein [Planctomycetaceae bacterium]
MSILPLIRRFSRLRPLSPPRPNRTRRGHRNQILGEELEVRVLLSADTYAVQQILDGADLVDGSDTAQLGRSVDISGNRMVVGAANPGVVGGGSVVVFERSAPGEEWIKTDEIQAPIGATPQETPAEFGFTVAVDGDHLVVGSPEYFTPGKAGSAFVYELSTTGWQLQASLTRPATAPSAPFTFFGYDVDIDEALQVAVIGERNSNDGGVYVYSLNDFSMTELLATPDLQNAIADGTVNLYNSEFGMEVEIYGNSVYVGAPQEDSANPLSVEPGLPGHGSSFDGAVHQFTLDQSLNVTSWSRFDAFDILTPQLAASDKVYGRLGVDMDFDDDGTLIVGAYAAGLGRSVAYVIPTTPAGTPDLQNAVLLRPENPAEVGFNFGESVSIDNGIAVVGSRYPSLFVTSPDYPSTELGRAYVFDVSGGNWSPGEIVAPTAVIAAGVDPTTGIAIPGPSFGVHLIADGDEIVVTAMLANDRAGYAAVFSKVSLNEPPAVPVDTDTQENVVAEGAAPGAAAGITVLATDDDDVVYSLSDDADGRFQINPLTGVVTIADPSLLDGPNVHVITVVATDTQGETSSADFSISVTNVAPSVETISSSAANPCDSSADGSVFITGTFSDVGSLDTHLVYVDWGDGSQPELANVTQLSKSFSAQHIYADGGVYAITVTVVDDDGGVSDAATSVAAIQGVGLSGGTLYIIGSGGCDDVILRTNTHGDQLIVYSRIQQGIGCATGCGDYFAASSFEQHHFSMADVQQVVAYLCDGNDYYDGGGLSSWFSCYSDTLSTIPQYVFGGSGNDVLIGGTG